MVLFGGGPPFFFPIVFTAAALLLIFKERLALTLVGAIVPFGSVWRMAESIIVVIFKVGSPFAAKSRKRREFLMDLSAGSGG